MSNKEKPQRTVWRFQSKKTEAGKPLILPADLWTSQEKTQETKWRRTADIHKPSNTEFKLSVFMCRLKLTSLKTSTPSFLDSYSGFIKTARAAAARKLLLKLELFMSTFVSPLQTSYRVFTSSAHFHSQLLRNRRRYFTYSAVCRSWRSTARDGSSCWCSSGSSHDPSKRTSSLQLQRECHQPPR